MGLGARSAAAAGACVSAAFILGAVACTGDDPQVGTGSPDGAVSEAAATDDGGADVTTDTSTNETGGDAGPCDLSKPFGAPELLSIAEAGSNNGSVRPTAAGIYFTSDRHSPGAIGNFTNADLYFAPRTATGFGLPQRLTPASTATADSAPTESPEGLVLFFDAKAAAGGPSRLHRATRTSTAEMYGVATALPAFTTGAPTSEDRFPYLVGTTLYFAGTSATTGFRGLYSAPTDVTGISGAPKAVPGIPAGLDANAPVVSADEKTIYFANSVAAGTLIYVATRGATNVDFGEPTKLPNVNVKDVVIPSGLSADGCDLYFHTVVVGERQMPYVARRPP